MEICNTTSSLGRPLRNNGTLMKSIHHDSTTTHPSCPCLATMFGQEAKRPEDIPGFAPSLAAKVQVQYRPDLFFFVWKYVSHTEAALTKAKTPETCRITKVCNYNYPPFQAHKPTYCLQHLLSFCCYPNRRKSRDPYAPYRVYLHPSYQNSIMSKST